MFAALGADDLAIAVRNLRVARAAHALARRSPREVRAFLRWLATRARAPARPAARRRVEHAPSTPARARLVVVSNRMPAGRSGAHAPRRRPRLGARARAAHATACGSAGAARGGARADAHDRRRGDAGARLVRSPPGVARALLRGSATARCGRSCTGSPAACATRRGLAAYVEGQRRVRAPCARARQPRRHDLGARLSPAARRARRCASAATAGRSACSSTCRSRRPMSSRRCRGRDELMTAMLEFDLDRLSHRAAGPRTSVACLRARERARAAPSAWPQIGVLPIGIDPDCVPGRRRRRRSPRSRACARCSGRASSSSASIASTTRRASPSGSSAFGRCSSAIPSGAARSRSSRSRCRRARRCPSTPSCAHASRSWSAASTASSARPTGCRCVTCIARTQRVLRSSIGSPTSALVTPLRDGMNLVAKEFVAAQDPRIPGVLVLSQFAGAAEEMTRRACSRTRITPTASPPISTRAAHAAATSASAATSCSRRGARRDHARAAGPTILPRAAARCVAADRLTLIRVGGAGRRACAATHRCARVPV